jgi:hypothetical protein
MIARTSADIVDIADIADLGEDPWHKRCGKYFVRPGPASGCRAVTGLLATRAIFN